MRKIVPFLTCALILLSAFSPAKAQYIRVSGTPDDVLPSGWDDSTEWEGTLTVSSCSATYDNSQFTITNTGGRVGSGTDDSACSFSYPFSGDLTASVCVLVHDQDGNPQYAQTGIMVRDAEDTANAAFIQHRLTDDNGQRVTERTSAGAGTSSPWIDTSTIATPYGLKVEVDSDLDSIRYFRQPGCSGAWEQVFSGSASWLGDGTNAFHLTSTPSDHQSAGLSTTSVFGSVSVSTSAVDHATPDEIGFAPTSYVVAETAGSVVLSVLREGDGGGACDLFVSTVNGTALGGTDFTALSNDTSVQFADTVIGSDTVSVTITDRAGVQGNRQFTATLTKDDCAGETLVNDTATITINETDTGSTFAWETQGDPGCPDGRETYTPGMPGDAGCTRGGFVANTTVFVISTLSKTGSGSLDEFRNLPCPKVGLFSVSGTIEWNGTYNADYDASGPASCSEQSLVGESAPGHVVLRDIQFMMRAADMAVSHLTIGHGDDQVWGDGDSIQMLQDTSHGNNIAENVSLYWAVDEAIHCYPGGNPTNGYLFWQSAVINPLNDSVHAEGLHSMGGITNEACPHAVLRSMFINARARVPLLNRSDGTVANNVSYNAGHGSYGIWYQFNNLDSNGQQSGSPVATSANVEWELMIHGPDSTINLSNPNKFACSTRICPVTLNGALWSSSSEFFQAGVDATWHDCTASTNACVLIGGSRGNQIQGSRITAVWPEGYVPETWTRGNAAARLAFANLIKDHAGPRPNDRLSHTETRFQYAIDGLSTHSEGGLIDTVAEDGGWPSITGATRDPRDGSQLACGIDMPEGADANTIQTSGLTKLHEWRICCHTDAVMPGGYREDTLELCSAP